MTDFPGSAFLLSNHLSTSLLLEKCPPSLALVPALSQSSLETKASSCSFGVSLSLLQTSPTIVATMTLLAD